MWILSPNERSRLTKYLVFRLKRGAAVRKALENFVENGRRGQEEKIVRLMLADISAGKAMHDVFLNYGLIDVAGHAVMDSGIPPAKCLPVIAEMGADANKISSVIRNAFLWPALIAIALSIGLLFANGSLTDMFSQAQSFAKTAGSSRVLTIPFVVRHEWFMVGVTTTFLLIGAAIRYTLPMVYKTSTGTFYRFAPWTRYQDWAAALSVFIALQQSGQSAIAATKTLSKKTPSPLLTECFGRAHEAATRRGIRFSESFSSVDGAIPGDLHDFFVDADQTGEVVEYLTAARDFCREQVDYYQETLRDNLPAIIKTFLVFVFGLVFVDMTNAIFAASMAGM